MEKIASKNIKPALHNRNANKTAVLFRRSNQMFLLWDIAASPSQRVGCSTYSSFLQCKF